MKIQSAILKPNIIPLAAAGGWWLVAGVWKPVTSDQLPATSGCQCIQGALRRGVSGIEPHGLPQIILRKLRHRHVSIAGTQEIPYLRHGILFTKHLVIDDIKQNGGSLGEFAPLVIIES